MHYFYLGNLSLAAGKLGIFFIPFLSLVIPISDSFTISFLFILLATMADLLNGKLVVYKKDILAVSMAIFFFVAIFLYSGSDDYKYFFGRFLSLVLYVMNCLFLVLFLRRATLLWDSKFVIWFYYGLFCAVIIGVVDFLLYYLTAKAYFPINFIEHYLGGGEPIYGFFQIGLNLIYRPGGLSGEPKSFGMFSVVLMILCTLLYKYKINVLFLMPALILALFGIVLSGSTSALLLCVIFFLFYSFKFVLYRKSLILAVSGLILISSTLFYYYLIFSGDIFLSKYDHDLAIFSSGVSGFINSRLLSRLGFEDFDYFTILSVSRDYVFYLMGNGGFLTNIFLIDSDFEGWWLTRETNIIAKSGFIFIHSMYGIFSFPLIIFPMFMFFRKILRETSQVTYGMCVIMIVVPVLFFLRSYMLYACILIFYTVLIFDRKFTVHK